jgi:hypothetical protein
VKVNLPAAFQDFVAIMLGYNAAIAILKARSSHQRSSRKFRAVRSTGDDPWKATVYDHGNLGGLVGIDLQENIRLSDELFLALAFLSKAAMI